ncbi:MAG: S9 family peptidase [Candidatus Sericytochromatia bacterium]
MKAQPDLIHLHFLQDSFGFELHSGRREWAFVSRWGAAPDPVENAVPGDSEPAADIQLMPLAGGFPQSLGLLQSNSPGSPRWSPDGQSLAWASAKGVCVYHLPTHELKTLSAKEVCQIDANKALASAGQFHSHPLWHPLLWHPDGNSLFYVVQEEDFQVLYESTINGKITRQWHRADGQIMCKAISPQGDELALAVRFWDGSSGEIIRLKCEDESLQSVCTLRHEFYLSTLVSYTADSKLLYRANHEGFAQLWLQDGQEAVCLDASPADVSSFVLSGDQLYYVQALPDFQDSVACIDLKTRQKSVLIAPQAAGLQILAVDTQNQSQGQTLYLYKSAPDLPGELVAYACEPNQWQTLTQIHPLRWQHQPVRAEGMQTNCPTLLYYPPDFDAAKTYPALVWIKGGPSTSVRQYYQAWPQDLARQGYLVACPNYRGSTGFGVAHMEAGSMGLAGQTDLEDIKAVAEALKDLPFVQEGTVGILGHSWGGYLTLMAVTRYPELFACAMASAGLYHLKQQQLLEDVRHYTYWLYGGWCRDLPERYADRSPLSQVSQLKTPLLLFHGKADPNVPFAQVQGFVDQAEKVETELETHFFEGEGHSYRRKKNLSLFYARTRQFLACHLKSWDFKLIPQGGQHLE